MNYVLTFTFDERLERVLLIQKNRPTFLAGKWNGIGGKIEANETPIEAAIREMKEEADITLNPLQLANLAQISFEGGTIHCFYSQQNIDNYATKTDELVRAVGFAQLDMTPLDRDAAWLVRLAYANLSDEYKRTVRVTF